MFSTRHSNSIILQPLTGSLKLEIQLGDCVKSVTHSNDWIVAATESRLRIYSAVSMMELETIPCSDIRYMSILESRILTISGLGLIVAWDLKRSNGILCTGEIPPGVVCCCTAQIEDSIRIYCGFKKGIVRIYKWKEECIIELGDMSTGSDEWISCLTYLSDSRLLAAGSWDSRIYLFDDTGNCQRTVQESSAPLSLLSHNSNSFLCGSYDGSITLHTFSLPSVSRPTTSATDEWP